MLIKKDETYYIQVITDTEPLYIPLDDEDVFEIQQQGQFADIEDLLVDICENDEELMLMMQQKAVNDNFLSDMIEDIITQKEALLSPIVRNLAYHKLSQAYADYRYDKLLSTADDKTSLELDMIFSDDNI